MNDMQRTPEWYKVRQGKVTASMCYLLIQNRKEPMTPDELEEYKKANPKSRATMKEVPFSQTTLTYLNGKVMEWAMSPESYIDYVIDSEPASRALRWGTECEPLARQAYERKSRLHVEDAPFVPYMSNRRYAGGSPDGIIRHKMAIVEFKCPYTLAVHLSHLRLTDGRQLLELNEQYYAQCQMNMMCCSSVWNSPCEWCDFVSYDPRVKKSLQLKILRIMPDEDYQTRLAERIRLAEEYIRNIYDEL